MQGLFMVLEYRDKLDIIYETPSSLWCICPVCHGDRLKISLSSSAYGAYKCWTNGCKPYDIREKLGINSKNYHLSPYKSNNKKSLYTGVERKIKKAKPVDVTPIELIACSDYTPIVPDVKLFAGGSKKKITIYPYSNSQRVYRLDSEGCKKQVYLQWWNKREGTWEAGSGPHTWQVYDRGLDLAKGNTAIWVEGEKTAEVVKESGLSAITTASPAHNYEYLYKILYVFFAKHPNIENLVVIPDDDEAGYRKASVLEQVCWYLKKGVKKLQITDIITDFPFEPLTGTDLADIQFTNLSLCLTQAI